MPQFQESNNSNIGSQIDPQIGFHGGSVNFSNFSQTSNQNSNEIDQLINSLRRIAESFPDVQRNETLMYLDDLQEDLKTPEKQKPQRMKTRLGALLTVIRGVPDAADFSSNLLELAEKLGVPIEFNQLHPSQQLPPSISEQPIPLAAHGIDERQAERLGASLTTFADDWDSPEMSLYDHYDAARASLKAR